MKISQAKEDDGIRTTVDLSRDLIFTKENMIIAEGCARVSLLVGDGRPYKPYAEIFNPFTGEPNGYVTCGKIVEDAMAPSMYQLRHSSRLKRFLYAMPKLWRFCK